MGMVDCNFQGKHFVMYITEDLRNYHIMCVHVHVHGMSHPSIS